MNHLVNLAIVLRQTSSPFYPPVLLLTLAGTAVALICASIYQRSTPDLYSNNVHGFVGWIVVGLLLVLSVCDVLRLASQRGVGWVRKAIEMTTKLQGMGRILSEGEGYGLIPKDAQEDENANEEPGRSRTEEGTEKPIITLPQATPPSFSLDHIVEEEEDQEDVLFMSSPPDVLFGQPSSHQPHRIDAESGTQPLTLSDVRDLSPSSSTSTLHHNQTSVVQDSDPLASSDPFALPTQSSRSNFLASVAGIAVGFIWCLVPVLGYASFLLGLTVYSGSCRARTSDTVTIWLVGRTTLS